MSDEEKNQEAASENAAPEEAPAEEPGGEEAEREDAPGEEPAAEEPAAEEPADENAAPEEAPGEEPAAEEAPGEEAPAEETAAEQPAAPAPPAPEAEPEEELSPKARRKRERSLHSGEARPPRSPEERVAERQAARRGKAAARRRARARARSKHEAGQGTPPAEPRPGSKKVRQGTVVSNAAEKTITVRIEVVRRHPVYEKIVRRTATIHAHDEGNEANTGDVVRVIESRPLSRTKRWRLVEVLERAR